MAHPGAPRRGARSRYRGELPPEDIADNVERFLIRGRSRRAWRVRALMHVVEWSPLTIGRRPLSQMSPVERRRLVEERYVDGRGIWGICAKARYLVLLGAYGDARLHAPTSYVLRIETPSVCAALAERPWGCGVVTTLDVRRLRHRFRRRGQRRGLPRGAGGALGPPRRARTLRAAVADERLRNRDDSASLQGRRAPDEHRDGHVHPAGNLRRRVDDAVEHGDDAGPAGRPRELEPLRRGARTREPRRAPTRRSSARSPPRRRTSPSTSGSTMRFIEGARSLGLSPERMRKALGDCRGCGNCNIGCVFDAKRSALATYVPWAEQSRRPRPGRDRGRTDRDPRPARRRSPRARRHGRESASASSRSRSWWPRGRSTRARSC